jgi:uracil-DNA glycosylase family 4
MENSIYPLDAPGFPVVGDDFVEAAQERGDKISELAGKLKNRKLIAIGPELEDLMYSALYDQGRLKMPIKVKPDVKDKRSMDVICGHRWGANPQGASAGPEPCEVMILGKQLGENEINKRRCLIGPTGKCLLDTATKLGIPRGKLSKWYVTNVIKTDNPDNGNSWRDPWVKNFKHMLYQELAIVRPKYLLCMGADAVKALLGKRMTLGKMAGRVEEMEFDMRRHKDDEPDNLTVLVMACIHPAAVLRAPERTDEFELSLSRFGQLTEGIRWDKAETDIDHRVIDNERDLIALAKEVRACGEGNIIGMDAEWNGEHPESKNAYIRCLQISWAHKKAACIVINGAGGAPAFKRDIRKKKNGKIVRTKETTTAGGRHIAVRILNKMLKGMRPCGHYFCSDLEWLDPIGLDLKRAFAAPESWQDCKTEGGLDTALMAHAVDETGDFSLTGQALRHTSAPRYDLALEKWKTNYCTANKLKSKELEGYGDCPDDILYPYANYDADVTRRIAIAHLENLDCDRFGNNCWEAFWVSQRAVLAVLEMKQTGMMLDSARVDELTAIYMDVKNDLERKLQKWAKWPKLNLASVYQVRELMFGTKYNGKLLVDGKRPRIRPEGARSLHAVPLLTTEKRPRKWSELKPGEEKENNASTNKSVLGDMLHRGKELLVVENGQQVTKDCKEIIGNIRDHRFIGRVLSSVLRPPKMDEEMALITDDQDNWVYGAGIAGSVCLDYMVRTTIYQTKETGRWSSARPPLQNISKRREPDYKRILGDRYKYPLRSILMAPPGYVLIEADYIGAELFGMAIMSGDPLMIEHAQRNQLDESDPNFYDIHSNVSVMAFNLDCEPTKVGLAGIGKKQLRIVAKSVIFGIAYGRGAKAIALAAKEEGIDITTYEAQQIIDTIFGMYPGLVEFFNECRWRSATQPDAQEAAPRWLCGPYGRFRRFPDTQDKKVRGDIERQAQNFPIQGMIADVVSLAVGIMYDYREDLYANGETRDDLDFSMCLQVHDAILSMVRCDHVDRYIDEVLPACMVQGVPIYPCGLDGMPIPNQDPHYLGIDAGVETHWGIVPMPDEMESLGIHPKHAHWKETDGGLTNFESYPRKIWYGGELHAVPPGVTVYTEID